MNVYEAPFFLKKTFSDTVGNELKENGQNIKVKEGNYDIRLDFTAPDNPKYLIKLHQ